MFNDWILQYRDKKTWHRRNLLWMKKIFLAITFHNGMPPYWNRPGEICEAYKIVTCPVCLYGVLCIHGCQKAAVYSFSVKTCKLKAFFFIKKFIISKCFHMGALVQVTYKYDVISSYQVSVKYSTKPKVLEWTEAVIMHIVTRSDPCQWCL